MAIEFADKKYIKVIKDGVSYNCVGVNVVDGGVTYNVWDSGSSVIYVVDTNVSYSEEVTNGDSVLTPTSFTPSKNGYAFVGWRTDKTASADVLTSKVMGTEPVTLYAVFKRTLTLTYYDGSTTKATKTGTQYYNNGNTSNPSFTMSQKSVTNWTARGWSTSADAKASINYNDGSTISIGSDTTIYGCYSQTITLSYNGNGASSGSASKQTDTRYWNSAGNYSNPTFTLASNGFSKSGFSFVQWHQGSTSGTAYKVGASVTLSASTTFYAEWFDNEITVFSATFNENIGSMTFTETSRNMDSNYLSSVMSKLSCGAGHGESEIREATILALTSKAKNEYKYVTITFRALLFVYYGNVKGSACGETLYNSEQISGYYTYTKKVAISNTNWKAVLESYNGSSSYGCDNNLAVQSIVLSVS